MRGRVWRGWALGVCLSLWASFAAATSVVFLNPGHADEAFWLSVSRFMTAAAEDLRIDLEVLYAGRDAARLVADARQVVARSNKPDYLIVVNEKQVAPEILRMTAGSGIRVFLLLNSISPEQAASLQREGVSLQHWVGSLVPNNEEAGYQMAKALIAAAKQLPMPAGDRQLLAISGDKATPASNERERGLRRALAEHPEVHLAQLVHGEWSQQRAREQTAVLLTRYPTARLLWAANDQMAFGAMQAAEARQIQPGRQMLFAGLNNSVAAMQARRDGRLSVLAAGHFTAGAWALVMLHDLHAGKALAPMVRQESLFSLLDETQARHFLERFAGERMVAVDFRQFSRVHNPTLSNYRFSLLPLLQ